MDESRANHQPGEHGADLFDLAMGPFGVGLLERRRVHLARVVAHSQRGRDQPEPLPLLDREPVCFQISTNFQFSIFKTQIPLPISQDPKSRNSAKNPQHVPDRDVGRPLHEPIGREPRELAANPEPF